MKKKKVITIVILILVLSCIAGVVFTRTERRKKQEEVLERILIAIEYQRQNGTFPRTSGHYADEAVYVSYDAIRENEMYVSLAAYKEWNREHGEETEELTLADIEEYWSELDDIVIQYAQQNPDMDINSAKSMTIEQLQELIKKKEDLSYEINMEIMKEQE